MRYDSTNTEPKSSYSLGEYAQVRGEVDSFSYPSGESLSMDYAEYLAYYDRLFESKRLSNTKYKRPKKPKNVNDGATSE
jgi:hypothetical protein